MANEEENSTNLEGAIDQLYCALKSNADREDSIRTVLGLLSMMTESPELRTVLLALELEPDVVGKMATPARDKVRARYERQLAEWSAGKRGELPDVLWDEASTKDDTWQLRAVVLDVARMLDPRGAPDPRWVEFLREEISAQQGGLRPSQVRAAVATFLEGERKPVNVTFQATWKLLGTLDRLNLVERVDDVGGLARSVVGEWGDRGTREGREDNTTVNEAKRLIGLLGKELQRRGHISEETLNDILSAGENASQSNRRKNNPVKK